MKRWKYVVILTLSFLATATVFIKACDCITTFWRMVFDFLAMIGSGVFCSTIVSCFIEAQNKAREKRDRAEQRKFVFSAARNSFIRLFTREILNISMYYSKYITQEDTEWVKEDVGLQNIGDKILLLLKGLAADEEKKRTCNSNTITVESMKQEDELKNHLVTNNKIYYKSLHQSLSELSTFLNTYFIAGLVTEQQVELLKELTWDIDDILLCDPDIGVGDGNILEFKRILFEKTHQYLSVLDVPDDYLAHAHYKNVFQK